MNGNTRRVSLPAQHNRRASIAQKTRRMCSQCSKCGACAQQKNNNEIFANCTLFLCAALPPANVPSRPLRRRPERGRLLHANDVKHCLTCGRCASERYQRSWRRPTVRMLRLYCGNESYPATPSRALTTTAVLVRLDETLHTMEEQAESTEETTS